MRAGVYRAGLTVTRRHTPKTAWALGWMLVACAGNGQHAEGDAPLAEDVPGAPVAVPVTLRVVNLCTGAVDVYVGDDAAPIFGNVRSVTATAYVSASVGGDRGVLRIRNAGDPVEAPPVSVSEGQQPASGDRATVVLRGNPCSVLPLWEQFGDASVDTLRIRFVDATGANPPIRLFMEQADGSFPQVAAVDTLGASSAAGAAVPIARPEVASVRVQVGSELIATPERGAPGYQVPAGVLRPGARLFVFSLFTPRPALFIVGETGTPPELPAVGGDPAGILNANPIISALNAVPDLCGAGASHFAFRDAAGTLLGELDATFAREAPAARNMALPPTSIGHIIVATPGPGCAGPPAGSQVSTGPLPAGERLVLLVHGSAATATMEVRALKGPPPGSSGRQIRFVNAALGAPPLDVQLEQTDGDAGSVVTMLFSAVPFGGASEWISGPMPPAQVSLAQRPSVSLMLGESTATMLAIGDWRPEATVPVRLLLRGF